MKKILVASIIGVAAVTSSFGQGAIAFDNFQITPYNQVYWNNTVSGVSVAGQAAQNANLSIQIWYALGTVADASLLTQGVTTGISFDSLEAAYDSGAGHGAGGFFTGIIQNIPGWTSGAVTFQLRAAGTQNGNTFTGSSALWQESAQIQSSALPANFAAFTPTLGVTVVPVPEPSTFALAGLGSAALLMFRRRK